MIPNFKEGLLEQGSRKVSLMTTFVIAVEGKRRSKLTYILLKGNGKARGLPRFTALRSQ